MAKQADGRRAWTRRAGMLALALVLAGLSMGRPDISAGQSGGGVAVVEARGADYDTDCEADFTHFTRYSYVVEGLELSAIRVTGTYMLSGAGGRFSVVDDDGFFTFAAVHGRWMSTGLFHNDRNPDGYRVGGSVPKSDLRLLKAAAEVGLDYYDYIHRKYVTPRPGQSAAAFQSFRDQITDRRRFFEKARLLVDKTLAQPGSSANPNVEVRYLYEYRQLFFFLERFMNPLSVAQYADLDRPGKLHRLCQAGEANPAVGQVVCSRDFLTGERRHDRREARRFCPKGIAFRQFAGLCDSRLGESCRMGKPAT